MSVVAVTGATGFVGRNLCQELVARHIKVRAISRALLQSVDLGERLAGADTLVHLAARVHVLHDAGADPRAQFWRSNVTLTQIAALAAQQARVKRFIFVSSAGVLGATSPPAGFSEDAAPCPHNAYTASKLAAEQWLTSTVDPRMGLVVLRPPLVYGAGAPGNFMRLLHLALKGWPLPLGALRAPRSLLAVRNLVDLLVKLASDASPVRATMLVADREVTCVSDLYQTVALHAGHRPWLAPAPPALIRSLLALTGRSDEFNRLTGAFLLRPKIAQLQFHWNPPHTQEAELLCTALAELAARRRAASENGRSK